MAELTFVTPKKIDGENGARTAAGGRALPQAPTFAPVTLPGLDLGFARSEAEAAAAGPVRQLSRGVRQAITQAGSEFGENPLAHRFAVRSALRGFQEALGPTLQAAHRVGLDTAQREQQIQAQEAALNAQRDFQSQMAQFNAKLQQTMFEAQADLARELAELSNEAAAQRLDTSISGEPREEDTNNVFQVPQGGTSGAFSSLNPGLLPFTFN